MLWWGMFLQNHYPNRKPKRSARELELGLLGILIGGGPLEI